MTDTKVNFEFSDNTTLKEDTDAKINTHFLIPICYNEKVQKLNESTINELELVKSIDKEETSIYEQVFKPSTKPDYNIINQISKYYTTDVDYLKQTQELTKEINSEELNTIYNKHTFSGFDIDDVVSLFDEIKGETGFCEKYLYVEWAFARHLNNNTQFLQLMSLYNIASPILSLCLPIFVLIIPFFVIKLKGIELNITQYISILKMLISNHSMFKIFTQFHEVDNGHKMYLVLSSAFYLFSIYQNILICIRFYSNMQKIHTYLFKFKRYLAYTLDVMKYHYSKTSKLTKYDKFNEDFMTHRYVLVNLYDKLNMITPFSFSFSKLTEIGYIMQMFYQLYDNPEINDSVLYSFGFNGYLNALCRISSLSKDGKLVETIYKNKNCKGKSKKPKFKKMYYPKFINEDENNIVKNDCDLGKNLIITGPNASGKTTTLKSVFINILLSQQIGFGCFKRLQLTPYDKLHCYLNIPDTSGRDSLFQAEARRCKEIIDCIHTDTDELTHFCIFDELYSGTNPEEAVSSANAFMDYLVKHENVTCMLTTHYIKLCKKLATNKSITNFHMKTLKENNTFNYTYRLEKGISTIKGGLKVLHDMQYPKEILDLANKIN